MSKLLGAIQQNREPVLHDWLQRLKAAVGRRRSDWRTGIELQAAEILSGIADVPAGTSLEDFDGAGWQPLERDALEPFGLSRDPGIHSVGDRPFYTVPQAFAVSPRAQELW